MRKIKDADLEKLTQELELSTTEIEKETGRDILDLLQYYSDVGFTMERARWDLLHSIKDKKFLAYLFDNFLGDHIDTALRLAIKTLKQDAKYHRADTAELAREWKEIKRRINSGKMISEVIGTTEHNRDKGKGATDKGSRKKTTAKKSKYKDTGTEVSM